MDLCVVWYSTSEEKTLGNRREVVAWANELGLPVGTLTRGPNSRTFVNACKTTEETWDDDFGRRWSIFAVQPKKLRAGESVLKMELHRVGVHDEETGEAPLKLAELRLHKNRRTSAGAVNGSQRITHTVRRALNPPDRLAAERWLAKFHQTYEEAQTEAPISALRRIARLTLLSLDAIPVRKKSGLYFVYSDRTAPLRRLEEFLARCQDEVDVIVLPVVADARTRLLAAEAADEMLSLDAGTLLDAIRAWAGKAAYRADPIPGYVLEWEGLMTRLFLHTERLGPGLSQSSYLLGEIAEALETLRPGALQSVPAR